MGRHIAASLCTLADRETSPRSRSALVGLPARSEHGWARTSYCPATDRIKMPPRPSFTNEAGYYATLFHELTHSTAHSSRLRRKTLEKKTAFAARNTVRRN
ncbi:MAG: zincin-like metallopeptidase domain-containing protein [Nitrospirota bacterium]